MTLARSIASGASLMLLGQWSKFGVQIAGTAILARVLSPGDFGLVAMVMATIGLATILADFGLSLAALREHNMSPQDRSNLFWANLSVGALASVTVALIAEPISRFYGRPELTNIVLALCGIFTLQAATSQFRAEISRTLRFHKIAIVDVAAQLVATAVAVGAAFNGYGYWALVMQLVLFALLQFVGLASIARWLPRLPRNLKASTRHFAFGSKASATQVINYISSNIDTVVLGKAWDTATVGIYNQAYTFFKMPVQQLASPLTHVMVPTLSRLDNPAMARYVGVIQSLLVYALGGVFSILASVATPLMALILGPGWEGVAPVLQILVIGGIFQAMGYVYYWVFIVKNCTGRQLVYGGIARLIMIVLIIALVPWGNNGVAAAVSIGLFINWVLLTIFVVPHAGLKRRLFIIGAVRPLIVIAFGFGLATGIQLFIPASLPDLQLVLVALGAWGIYICSICALIPALRTDLLTIIRAVKPESVTTTMKA